MAPAVVCLPDAFLSADLAIVFFSAGLAERLTLAAGFLAADFAGDFEAAAFFDVGLAAVSLAAGLAADLVAVFFAADLVAAFFAAGLAAVLVAGFFFAAGCFLVSVSLILVAIRRSSPSLPRTYPTGAGANSNISEL